MGRFLGFLLSAVKAVIVAGEFCTGILAIVALAVLVLYALHTFGVIPFEPRLPVLPGQ